MERFKKIIIKNLERIRDARLDYSAYLLRIYNDLFERKDSRRLSNDSQLMR